MVMKSAFSDVKSPYIGQYGWALHAIGQDLAELRAETFEIRTDEMIFVVRCHSRIQPNRLKRLRWTRSSRFRHAHARTVADRLARSQLQFVRRYTLDDLRRLETLGFSGTSGFPSEHPAPYGLAERLKAIGMIVDSNSGRLLNAQKNINNLTFEYEDATGETHTWQDFSLTSAGVSTAIHQ
jgi:hypothetical protein